MLIITSLVIAILTIIFIRLSFAVIGLRRKNKVGLGSGGIAELERAIRAHGNFAEYVPLGLLLIACLELNGANNWIVAILGISLITGRLIHAQGINTPPPNFTKRVLGMQITFATLATSAIINILWSIYKIIIQY